MKKNDNNGLFLILAAVAALAANSGQKSINKGLQKKYIPSQTITHTVDTEQTNEDLIEQQRILIQEEAKEILANLGIEDLQGKSADEQKQAAYKILKYVIYAKSTSDKSQDENTNNVKQSNSEINSIYQSLCEGRNVDSMTSESMALNLLYNMCGLDSKRVTIQKNFGQGDRSSKLSINRDVVFVNFNGEQEPCVCDPIHTKIAGKNTKGSDDLSGVFMSTNSYFNAYKKNYQIVAEHKPVSLDAQLTVNTPTTDLGMER